MINGEIVYTKSFTEFSKAKVKVLIKHISNAIDNNGICYFAISFRYK